MTPIFKINGHDYSHYIASLAPSRNDLDADGSGRNILNGLMYRSRIDTKRKYTVSCNKLDEATMRQLASDTDATYMEITITDFETNTQSTKTYYSSAFTAGTQMYDGGELKYTGCTFNIIER